MKLLVLSRYDRLGASSRHRMLQFFPYLKAAGFDVQLAPFFPDDYLKSLYSGASTWLTLSGSFIKRMSSLRRVRDADVIWLEKEALPWLPWAVESALLPAGVPVVSDYDDAVFHNYDLHRSGVVRRLLGRKFDRVMATSALVMAGNAYLAERAHSAGAPRVEIVPTVQDADAYPLKRQSAEGEAPRIGWIGSPSTWTNYMAPMLPMLLDLAERHGARLKIVGAAKNAPAHPLLENEAWSEETEGTLIESMDIGVMPLDDSSFARGKCGTKLIQYMACGLPVVASPVGVNRQIVEHGVNGFLAETEAEWRHALETLLADPDLRRRMGDAGRRKMEAEYSLQAWGKRVAGMLAEVARGPQRPA